VYPSDYQGKREEPSFTSLLQAYYGAGLGDWSVSGSGGPAGGYDPDACRTLQVRPPQTMSIRR